MGHEDIKAMVVSHLADNLAPWLELQQQSGWPPAPKTIAVGDLLPEKDAAWPCLLVGTSDMLSERSDGGEQWHETYAVHVTIGIKGVRERDQGQVTAGRDRLLQAVKDLLRAHPGLGEYTHVALDTYTETTGALNLDEKNRLVALGSADFRVIHTASTPDLEAVPAVATGVSLAFSDAADQGDIPVVIGAE